MRQTVRWAGMAMLVLAWNGTANAQEFAGQQERAVYAGAYFSLSFGGGEKAYKRPVRYGFSAGLRQSNFSQTSHYYSPQFNRQDANINMFGGNDWQARVVDLNFSDRGFEHLSLSGMAFAQKDTFGRLRYLGGRGLYADDEDDGSGISKILLWTGVVVGAAGLTLYYAAQYRGG